MHPWARVLGVGPGPMGPWALGLEIISGDLVQIIINHLKTLMHVAADRSCMYVYMHTLSSSKSLWLRV